MHQLQTLHIDISVGDLKKLSELNLGVTNLKMCVVDWSKLDELVGFKSLKDLIV